MRSADNFNPEWGYLAPAPNFLRTARIALVAAAIGATSGGAVVYALVEPPSAEDASVAARTLVRSSDSTLAAGTVSPAQAVIPAQPHIAASALGAAPEQAGGSNPTSTAQGPASVAALAEVPAVAALAEAPALVASQPPAASSPSPGVRETAATASAAPVQRKVVQKPRAVWPSAPREQAFAWPYGTSRAPVAVLPSGASWPRGED